MNAFKGRETQIRFRSWIEYMSICFLMLSYIYIYINLCSHEFDLKRIRFKKKRKYTRNNERHTILYKLINK